MPPARATLLPTPGLCKSSRLPWPAVLLSAPSKHCVRRRLLAHAPEAAGQRAGSLLPPLCPPNAPARRALELSKRSAGCVGRESNPGQLLGRQLCSPLYHQRSTARAAATRRPRARPSILSPPPPPHPCPDARQPEALRRRRRPQQPRGAPSAPALRRRRDPPAPPPCGPPALRSPPRPANASALTPGGQRGARSFQHPAGQSPTPPGAGRGHFPRRQGDTGPTCLHASRRRDEPRGVAVASLRAHSGSHWGSVRGRVAGPPDPAMVGQGRGVAKEALAPPWRPCARRRQRAQAGALLGQRGSTGARPGTAVGRPGASPKDGGRGRRALGGLAAGQRGTAATKKGVLPPRRGIEPRSPA